ncbi:MAG: leucine-rich repeat-containing protein kinase family protein [Ghiorsea sp.]
MSSTQDSSKKTTRINIKDNLTAFPQSLYDVTDSLEVLDLSGNKLSSLPAEFSRFQKLRILFLSDNCFESIPEVLAECPALTMIGFKSNQIKTIAEYALPENVRWLILTDNQISKLPETFGRHQQLQKLMLAGNAITSLPDSMAMCRKLELCRLSANQLATLPEWLVTLPRLSWLAFAGNPCCPSQVSEQNMNEIHWDELQISHELGSGASGIISKALWKERFDMALKAFKGDITSDGMPEDEMAISIAVGEHKNLVDVIGKLTGHPEKKEGLLLSLIADDYVNLAGSPSLDSCTRDTYAEGQTFSLQHLLRITAAIASVSAHIHNKGIMHGDLYGHNILINQQADCILGDFGAATEYQRMSPQLHQNLEQLEVRAFGCLLEELTERLDTKEQGTTLKQLKTLTNKCLQENVSKRPLFKEISAQLTSL